MKLHLNYQSPFTWNVIYFSCIEGTERISEIKRCRDAARLRGRSLTTRGLEGISKEVSSVLNIDRRQGFRAKRWHDLVKKATLTALSGVTQSGSRRTSLVTVV